MLSKAEMALAARLMDKAADEFSNHGCNDFSLPYTPSNLKIVKAMLKDNGDEEMIENGPHVNSAKTKIYTYDSMVMRYLAQRLEEESK